MRVRLPVRLLASSLVVLVVGMAVTWASVRLLTPQLFDRTLGRMMGNGPGNGGAAGQATTRAALLDALDTSLAIGALIAAVVAGAAAAYVTRRLLTPLDAVRATTRRIAAGHYDARVEVPAEPEVAALAEDVNTLASALAETETRRVRLLGEVAHEMRTPLTAAEGYVEGLVDGVFAPDDATLGAIAEELRRLRRLAEDLSALSRAEEGRTELRVTSADLPALVERVGARLAPQFDDAGVRLTVHPAPPVQAPIDTDRIAQVLTNLLGNALVACSATRGDRPGAVDVRTSSDGTTARVEVTDTGVGLGTADLERVFERFYRAPGPGVRRSEGSGIGLTIARSLARGHGGDLTALSPGPGAGATFRLTLPLVAPPPPSAAPSAPSAPSAPAGMPDPTTDVLR